MTVPGAATRRAFVRRGALLGGLTVAASVPGLRAPGRASAQAEGDKRILAGAIGLEHAGVLAYGLAVTRGGLEPALAGQAREFSLQEQEHADRLVTELEQLGGTPPRPPARASDVPGLAAALAGGRRATLAFLVAREETAVGVYHRAVQDLVDAKLIQLTGSIVANHGQHLVVLRQALRVNPVPNAFDTGWAR